MSGSIHRADAIASGGGRRWGSVYSPNKPLQQEQPTVEKTSGPLDLGTQWTRLVSSVVDQAQHPPVLGTYSLPAGPYY